MIGASWTGAISYLLSDFAFDTFTYLTPVNGVFWGMLGATICAFPFMVFSKKRRTKLIKTFKRDWKVLILISILTTIGALIWWYTIKQTSSGLVSLLGESRVLFVFILGVVFLKDKYVLKELLALSVALIGFIFISNLQGEITLWIAFLCMLSRVFYSLQSFIVKKYAPELHGPTFAFTRITFMVILVGAFYGIQQQITMIPLFLIGILTVALISAAIISKSLYFEAHNYLEMSKLNMYLILQSVFVLFGATFLLGHSLSFQKVFGATLILLGIALFYREQAKIST